MRIGVGVDGGALTWVITEAIYWKEDMECERAAEIYAAWAGQGRASDHQPPAIIARSHIRVDQDVISTSDSRTRHSVSLSHAAGRGQVLLPCSGFGPSCFSPERSGSLLPSCQPHMYSTVSHARALHTHLFTLAHSSTAILRCEIWRPQPITASG